MHKSTLCQFLARTIREADNKLRIDVLILFLLLSSSDPPVCPVVGFIEHDYEPRRNKERDQMSKLMVRGGKQQGPCSHSIALR